GLGPPPAHVPAVGRARGQPVHAVALAADPDRRMRLLHGPRVTDPPVERGGPAAEFWPSVGPHATDDVDALRELLDALADGRERDAVRAIFLLEPAGAQAQVEPALADDVERGRHLREHRWRAIRVAQHARAAAH